MLVFCVLYVFYFLTVESKTITGLLSFLTRDNFKFDHINFDNNKLDRNKLNYININ